ncbi:unnamed protein product [Nezara viridula]|uniref:Uncharacterized protein n=1 Tax=Nezara viridula TaxID=85310 RepID=A0A9P0HCP8_NEZVI|nr:unnamed protein product [Nezara viridula]
MNVRCPGRKSQNFTQELRGFIDFQVKVLRNSTPGQMGEGFPLRAKTTSDLKPDMQVTRETVLGLTATYHQHYLTALQARSLPLLCNSKGSETGLV